MEIRFNFDMLFDERLKERRFDENRLKDMRESLRRAKEEVLSELKSQKRGFSEILYNDQILDATLKLSKEISGRYKNLVLIGIGGSSLGPRALFRALRHPFHNFLPNREEGMNLFFLENVDPDTFRATFDVIDEKDTAFVVITKSGSTVETMSQFLIIRDRLIKKLGENGYRERMIAITDPQKGTLREIIRYDRLCSLPIPENIGGRFSVFSPVGTFPAACCGIDVSKLLSGAREMNEEILNSDVDNDPALKFASLMYIARTHYNRNILIVMPYKDSLLDTAEWFQQLWAESLGKERDRDGNIVNTGSTPVRALGVIDQHSQLQLYIEGPQDKVVMIIGVKEFNNTVEVPPALENFPDVSYIGNHSLNEILKIEEDATLQSLINARRPAFSIELERVDEANLGALMLFFEFATAYSGSLYNINAFDQPGVEHGKKILYRALKKPGYF
jgi:glucose-6-phosphate isomerase